MIVLKQNTIKKAFALSGIGLHTGCKVTITFNPAPADHGLRFKRTDLPTNQLILADTANVSSTNRSTTLSSKEASVTTVEHALSALYALGVDNCLIEVDAPEAPILDGSAVEYVNQILLVGIEEQESNKDYLEIKEPISYRDETTGAEIVALPSEHFSVTTMIDFNSQVVGMQYAHLEDLTKFPTEIAPCRTFVFLHELEQLLDNNLIKGGDIDNAIVIVDRIMNEDELARLAIKLDKPNVKVDKEGILNTVSLHFSNEPARHKLLDLIGDLALVGVPIKGKIVATKPGHFINTKFASLLKEEYKSQKKQINVPKYNPSIPPIFDVVKISKALPHRYPFLLVDKIIELTEEYVVGVKSVTFNEEFFQGHFPGNPVMPGVLQIEAMAQTGGILVLNSVTDPENWDTYFLKIDNARFKAKVVPGDTLIIRMELLSPIRRGLCHMRGIAYVGNKVVSEAELLAQIVRSENR